MMKVIKMTRGLMTLLLIQSAGLLVATKVNDSEQRATLNVLRCCRDREDLDSAPRPDNQLPGCVPSSTPFKPDIYSPSDYKFLDSVPATWQFVPGVRPSCPPNQLLRYVQYSKSNPYFLFDTGVAITELGSDTQLKPHEYCLGSNGLLACMPVPVNEGHPAAATMKPRLRKCCGVNAAYEK